MASLGRSSTGVAPAATKMPPKPAAADSLGAASASEAKHDSPGLNESARSSTPSDTDEVVFQIAAKRRWVILFAVCWASIPVNFVSNPLLAATPEVAADFGVPAVAVTNANSAVLAGMALSPFVWLPMCTIFGRRTALLNAQLIVSASLLIAIFSPNLVCFAAFWVLAGSTTPFFLVAGQTIITDIFEPTIRGRATGCFIGVSVITNTIAPMIGALVAEFATWKVVLGITSGISAIGFVLSFLLVPRAQELQAGPVPEKTEYVLGPSEAIRAFNPAAVFRQLRYPKVLFAHIVAGLLGFNMYAILSSVRRIINPRFGLTSPLTSGLFYLAPGVGTMLGATLGGAISDCVVKRYIKKRNGLRVPQDRLRACVPAILFVMPLGTLTYGWSVHNEVGGMVLPAAGAFVHGFGLMVAFSSLNTYAGEAMPGQKTAVISSKYLFQYGFASAGLGAVGPLIDSVGVGWTVTITTAVAFVAAALLIAIIVNPELAIVPWFEKTQDYGSRSNGHADI